MTDPINLQIFDALAGKLTIIRTANGFHTDIGSNVLEAVKNRPSTTTPACIIFAQIEDHEGGTFNATDSPWKIRVEGQADLVSDPVRESLLIQADLIECIAGYALTVSFDSGGTTEITAGMTLVGATSTYTGYVMGVTVATGTWAGGDAAGTLTIRRHTGLFANNENLNISGGATNVATVDGAPVAVPPETSTGGLCSEIKITEAGVEEWGSPGATVVAAQLTVSFDYNIKQGNPHELGG